MECRTWKRVQGKIVHNNHNQTSSSTVLETLLGNGAWESYFESLVEGFDYPHDVVGQDLPLIELAPLSFFALLCSLVGARLVHVPVPTPCPATTRQPNVASDP